MAGTFHGHVDCLITCPTNQSGAVQEMFTNVFQHFQNLASSSYALLISLYTGSNATGTPAGAGGTNYHNQNNPFGENAWFCFKMPSGSAPDTSVSVRAYDYYVLMSWCNGNNPSTGKGSPMQFNGANNTGIGYAIAWRDDGQSPWNGTTFSTQSNVALGYGQDTLGAAIWTAGSSTLHVLPRANGSNGGSFNKLQNDLALAWDNPSFGTSQTTRQHIIGDRDSFFMIFDYLDNSAYDNFVAFGVYDTIPTLTTGVNGMVPMPMYAASCHSSPVLSLGSTWGDTAGTSAQQGGIVAQTSKMTATSRGWRNDRFATTIMVAGTPNEPNPQFPSASFDFFKIPVIMYESTDFGFMGYINSFNETFNCNVNSANSGSTLAVFGQAPSSNTPQWVVPFGGGNPPGTLNIRSGVFF